MRAFVRSAFAMTLILLMNVLAQQALADEPIKTPEFVYSVTGHRVVVADDLSVLRTHHHEQLELQACHPRFFATHRYIAYAKLVSVRMRGASASIPGAALAAAARF